MRRSKPPRSSIPIWTRPRPSRRCSGNSSARRARTEIRQHPGRRESERTEQRKAAVRNEEGRRLPEMKRAPKEQKPQSSQKRQKVRKKKKLPNGQWVWMEEWVEE